MAHDLVAITDEVYEHLTFDGVEHVPLATLPGMRDRTITISSAGKTFSFTGWKIGWACASPDLLAAVRTAKQFLTYVNGAPFQHAIVAGLGLPDAWFHDVAADLGERRDLLVDGLRDAGFTVFPPRGTYFVTVDAAPARCHRRPRVLSGAAPRGAAWSPCRTRSSTTTLEAGRTLVRFTFCKRREVLEEAVQPPGRRLRLTRTTVVASQTPDAVAGL